MVTLDVPSELGGERPREADDTELAGAVGGGVRHGPVAECRGHCDDAAAVLVEPRQRGAHDGGGPEQVDGHGALPHAGVNVLEAAGDVDAGAGHDRPQTTFLLGHLGDRLLGGPAVGQVDLDAGDAVGRRPTVEAGDGRPRCQ